MHLACAMHSRSITVRWTAQRGVEKYELQMKEPVVNATAWATKAAPFVKRPLRYTTFPACGIDFASEDSTLSMGGQDMKAAQS